MYAVNIWRVIEAAPEYLSKRQKVSKVPWGYVNEHLSYIVSNLIVTKC